VRGCEEIPASAPLKTPPRSVRLLTRAVLCWRPEIRVFIRFGGPPGHDNSLTVAAPKAGSGLGREQRGANSVGTQVVIGTQNYAGRGIESIHPNGHEHSYYYSYY